MGRYAIILYSVIVTATVKMRVVKYCVIFYFLFLNSYAFDCRSEGGPKENELKKVYDVCIKQQNKNNSNNDGSLDQDWRETRRYNQWSKNNAARKRENVNNGYGMETRDQLKGSRINNRDRTEEQHKINRQDERNNNRDNTMQYRNKDGVDEMYSRDKDEWMPSRDARGENQKSTNDNRSQRHNGVNGRNDFFQNENFGGYNNNQYSTQPIRRYKRERRVEVNSGKRSQYNPNPQRFSGYDEKYKGERKDSNESNSTTDDNSNACALHCLLENLQMTDESGMPDRYLVTHVITKDVKDEDLNDFLQEAIDECFRLLDNEDTDDKCEFSKNLLMCLSEKGRANCDDWKEDFQF